jgi:hypothetical protein
LLFKPSQWAYAIPFAAHTALSLSGLFVLTVT